MKLLQIYNQYRSGFNGEEAVVYRTHELLENHGNQAELWMKSSREITSLAAKLSAFGSGVYSRKSYREARARLRDFAPDVVHAHNLYPLFSPSVLAACRAENVPVVLSVHNQSLTCPRADHLYRGEICDKCVGGGEYRCAIQNCRGNILESIAYATRSYVARRLGWIANNATRIVALTEFARQRLIAGGYPGEKIVVLPNMVDLPPAPTDPAEGSYFAFAGRLSPEKGIDALLAAAKMAPEIEIRVAGDGPLLDLMRDQKPTNVVLCGRLDKTQMREHYRNARAVVVPSTSYEMCPLVILEAMAFGLPVIASRIGGLGELVDDEATGYLFPTGDSASLALRMRQLQRNPSLARRLGLAGRAKAAREYSEDVYLHRLLDVYNAARAECGRPPVTLPLRETIAPETVTV